MKISQPLASEYNPFYGGYIEKIGDQDVIKVLNSQLSDLESLFSGLSEEILSYAYGEGKWTVVEVLGHMVDVERIMSYRMLRFCRGDKTALPGFEENDYVISGKYSPKLTESLLLEFNYLRKANLELIGRMEEHHLTLSGESNGSSTSVRALIYILAGHLQHHMGILVERYKL
ncbi:DinB family protein [Marinoscillum pacificum]|uniref:DinB family protein n=1 Tax=Marinoscillum pacificum TaxID=392723 RepID=UPI002157FA08|nr:DinB family protein [Marinoscillum pacificum]